MERESVLAGECATLIDILEARAVEQAERIAYRFLISGEVDGPVEQWTYGTVAIRSHAIAAMLQDAGAAGDRALLVYPPGLDFIAAFLGCLCAGVVAVPCFPPDPARLDRTLPRLRAVAEDCDARFALTTGAILGMADAIMPQIPTLAALRWLATDTPGQGLAAAYRRPALTGHTLAFLQYTSGSTSKPKGVMVSHANILHNERMIADDFGHDTTLSGVGWLPLFHDMGLIGNVLQPLYVGGSCTLMSPLAFLQKPLRWLQAISRQRATSSGGPNFAYDLCVRKISDADRATLDLSSWGVAFNGAEAVRKDTLDRFAEAFAPCGFRREAFHPCYGLAEATLLVTGARKGRMPVSRAIAAEPLQQRRVVDAADAGAADTRALVSSGRAVPGLEVVIVDPDTRTRCPADRAGEIWVSGPSVAQGYWNRPDVTESRFRASLADTGQGPFLRTGDLGFMRDGELFVLDRLDDMIIINGQNLYPADIELCAERAHAAIRPGCCAAFSIDGDGASKLVVAAEAELGSRADSAAAVAAAIRGAVAEQQGAAVDRVVLVRPRTIPKTSSGKIQRHACRAGLLAGTLEEVARVELATAAPHAAPRTATEQALAALMAEVLGGEALGVHDDFFARGGHSLLAAQAVTRIRDELGVDLPLRALFEHPTVTGLATVIDRMREAGRGAHDVGPAGEPLTREPPLTRVSRDAPLPLSFAQLRLWVLWQLEPASVAYNMTGALRLAGPVDVPALTASLSDVVARHEILRTTFRAAEPEPRQIIHDHLPLELNVMDLEGLPAAQRDTMLRAAAEAHVRTPFDLVRGPLLRAELVRLSGDEHVLLFAIHHIIADAWSMTLLVREVGALYGARVRGGRALPAAPALHYADYAAWQRQRGDALAADLDFWRDRLAHLPGELELPRARSRAGATRRPGGAEHVFDVLGDVPGGVAALRALCSRERATLFMGLLAVFKALLVRYSEQHDVLVGSPIAGRTRAATEGMLGCFVNLLVLRTDASGNPSFAELIGRVKDTALAAYSHQQVPFERIVRELAPERELGRTPLVQVVFNLHGAPALDLDLPGLRVTPLQLASEVAKFDLSLEIEERPDRLIGRLHYDAALFDDDTIARMARHYENLLGHAVADASARIGDVDLLDAGERTELLEAWNQTAADLPPGVTVHGLVEAQVARSPHAVAVWSERGSLTYAELDARATACAGVLLAHGARPEAPVAVCMRRSPASVAWLLGVLKAGCAYLPLAPDSPGPRARELIADAGATIVVADPDLRRLFDGAAGTIIDGLEPVRAIDHRAEHRAERRPVDSEQLAYILYTSGSSGRPKGVLVHHRAVCNHLLYRQAAYPLGPGDRFVHKAASVFDIAIWELFAPLIAGATAILARPDGQRDSSYLAKLVIDQQVTDMHFVPFMLKAFLEAPASRAIRSLRRLFCGGESLSTSLAKAVHERFPGIELVHQYGPTEATIDATTWTARPDHGGAIVPIGAPIQNTTVYVLDGRQHPMPVGVIGELYIGGAGVARGYLGAPGATAERFVPDPFSALPGARMYRTGDRAYWLPGGALMFAGRVDQQVKVRGHRIEPGEVEAALRDHPDIAELAVVARAKDDSVRLIAYVVPRPGATVDAAGVRAFLEARLPEPMIPSGVVSMSALPVTTTGKIDRRALPDPDDSVRAGAGRVAPRTDVEQTLCAMFAEVLGDDRIGIHDDFFAMGGDSFIAARLVSRITERFGVELPPGVFFEAPTVAALATYLGPDAPAPGRSHIVPLRSAGTRPPLFCIHSAGGHVFPYQYLAAHLGVDQPVYGVQSGAIGAEPTSEIETMDEMAATYAGAIRAVQPHGPYSLLGWSFGGVLALAIAGELERGGEVVAFVGLLDVYPTDARPADARVDPLRGVVFTFGNAFTEAFEAFPAEEKARIRQDILQLGPKEQLVYMLEWARPRGLLSADLSLDLLDRQQGLVWIHAEMAKSSRIPVIDAPIHQWFSCDRPDGLERIHDYPSWQAYTRASAHVELTGGDHFTFLRPPWCEGLARSIATHLAAAAERAPARPRPPGTPGTPGTEAHVQASARGERAAAELRGGRRHRGRDTFELARQEIAFAYDHVRFFRKHMDDADLRPADIRTPEDLRRIPVTRKSHYRRHFPAGVLARGKTLDDPFITRSQSSGTGGERLITVTPTFVLAERMNMTLSANPRFGAYLAGIPGRRTCRYAAPNCSDVECATPTSTTADRTLPDGTLVLPVHHDLLATPEAMRARAAGELMEYAPHWLYVDPTHLAFLLRTMKQRGMRPPGCGAIALTYSMTTQVARRQIQACFPADVLVAAVVSMSELGWLAMECPAGNMHINTHSYHLELLAGDRPAEPGELAELHVTSIGDHVSPHIRYQTGDLYRLSGTPCACGHAYPVVRAEGRGRNMLVRGNDVRLTPRELDDLVGAAAWLDLYKMHQVDDEHFVFRYVAGEHHDRGHAHELARRLRDALGATARIDIEAAGYIAGERSGKFEPCTSDVAAARAP